MRWSDVPTLRMNLASYSRCQDTTESSLLLVAEMNKNSLQDISQFSSYFPLLPGLFKRDRNRTQNQHQMRAILYRMSHTYTHRTCCAHIPQSLSEHKGSLSRILLEIRNCALFNTSTFNVAIRVGSSVLRVKKTIDSWIARPIFVRCLHLRPLQRDSNSAHRQMRGHKADVSSSSHSITL